MQGVCFAIDQRGHCVCRPLSTGKDLRIPPSPTINFNPCPCLGRPEAGKHVCCFRAPASPAREHFAARFSAVRSPPQPDFQLSKCPGGRERAPSFIRGSQNTADPRSPGLSAGTGIFLSRVGHPVTTASSLLLRGVPVTFVFLRLWNLI